MAAARMQAQLNKADGKKKSKGDDSAPEKGDQKSKSKAKTSEKSKAASSGEKRAGPENGPMFQTFQAFVAKRKSKGMSHADAVAAWKTSKQRAAIVDNMSEAERKKRRY